MVRTLFTSRARHGLLLLLFTAVLPAQQDPDIRVDVDLVTAQATVTRSTSTRMSGSCWAGRTAVKSRSRSPCRAREVNRVRTIRFQSTKPVTVAVIWVLAV